MELELKFAELACCEPVGDLVTTQEESMETAIPEYCPDIARIVDTVGQLRLREKHPAGQQLTMGGSVVLTVLSLGTRVALAYALAGPVGESGIWWAIPIGWFLADAVGLGYYFRHRRTLLPDRRSEE